MPELQRISSNLGAGTLAHLLLPKLRAACDQLGATRALLTQGVLEFNRATVTGAPNNFGRDGVLDVSPPEKDIRNAIGNSGSDEIAEINRPLWQPLVHRTIQKVVEAHQAAKLVDGQTLWVQGFKTGHGRPADEALRLLKARVPASFIVVLSTLPEDLDKRVRLRTGYDLFTGLWREGIVEMTILVDNSSPFARDRKLVIQDQFLVKAMASLLATQLHFARNASLAEIGRSLGDYSPLVGVAFASCAVAACPEPGWWLLLKELVDRIGLPLPARGRGDVGNLVRL